MVADPAAMAEKFAHAGADLISVHIETRPAAAAAVQAIGAAGQSVRAVADRLGISGATNPCPDPHGSVSTSGAGSTCNEPAVG